MARLIELIITHSVKGRGIESDPMRSVTELWSKQGKLLASVDNWNGDSWVDRSLVCEEDRKERP